MDKKDRPLFDVLRNELGTLAADVRKMATLRWELARLELQSDARTVARLAIVWTVSVILALVSLPVLVVALACALDGVFGIPQGGWLVIFGLGLILIAMLSGISAWRRFRKNFIGLEETLEELHEDMVWLREWNGQ